MQHQLVEILSRIDATAEVVSTHLKLEAIQTKMETLRQSQTRLAQETHQLSKQLSALSEQSEVEVIFGTEVRDLADSIRQKESEHRLSTRAHQRLVERMLPETEIQELIHSANHLAAKARATREEAAARIEQTAKLMAKAAEFEGHISFDSANTLSGALIAHAEEMEMQVDNYRRWASEREEKHQRILRELESIQLLRG